MKYTTHWKASSASATAAGRTARPTTTHHRVAPPHHGQCPWTASTAGASAFPSVGNGPASIPNTQNETLKALRDALAVKPEADGDAVVKAATDLGAALRRRRTKR